MEPNIYELSDGRNLGIKIIEITSFPDITAYGQNQKENKERISKSFLQLVTEMHKLSGNNVCLEILWITDSVKNQTFSSKIRIFCIIRKIDNDKGKIVRELNNIQDNIISTMGGLQYSYETLDAQDKEFNKLLGRVDDSCVYSIVKGEKCIANVKSVYPYYFTEIVPNNNIENFNALISTLSQYEDCCVSFQVFPVNMTNEEIYLFNEISAELGRIERGTVINSQMYQDSLAAEPFKVFSYYNDRRNSPMFMYNILTFGERAKCASLATKLVSLLQSGKDKIGAADFRCLDLSNEKIHLTSQFTYYVWNVNNRIVFYYRNKKIQSVVPLARKLIRLPYIMSAEEVISFFRLPLHEKHMISLASNQIAYAKEQFSDAVVNDNNIQFGQLVTNDSGQISIGCSERAFTKHALIVGTPGSGKTTFSVNLLLQFFKKGIPFLAIEPTKTEYRAMIDAIPELQIFTPGNNGVSPYIINPFIPPKGIRIEQYIPSLASAFKAAFSMPAPLDMIFLKAIRACYIQYGWKDYSRVGDKDIQLFGLHEFILVFKKLIENTNYSNEVRGNIESAGLLRLTNLIEQNSNIYDTINTVSLEDLLTKPTVLELNAINNVEQKSLIIALLLINICIYTKHNQIGDGKLKNVLLIDEAHVLLGGGNGTTKDGTDPQATTIKALQDMIAEIRSYGTSIIIADQSPTKVSREVVANTDIKVSFRLVQSAEKELIADSTNMDTEAMGNLSRLKPGEAYVYYSKLETPQMVRTDDIREKEGIRLSVSDEEVSTRSTYWDTRQPLLKPYHECQYCSHCREKCDFAIRSNAEYISNKALTKYRAEIKSVEDLKKCIFYLPNLMATDLKNYKNINVNQLLICSRIKLLRKIMLEIPVTINEAEKKKILTGFTLKDERE